MSDSPLLKVSNLSVYYGSICALKKISLQIEKGEIVALVGANGAGKSSLMKTLSGVISTQVGEVYYQPNSSIIKLSGLKKQ